MAVLRHRLGVVDHVVQVHLAVPPVLGAAHPGARAGLAGHAIAERGWVGQDGGDEITGCDIDVAHTDLVLAVEAQQVERSQDLDELIAEAVLEGHALAVDPPRYEHDLLVLDVHALDRADPLGELEHVPVPRTARW